MKNAYYRGNTALSRAMIHWAGWFGAIETLRFPKGTEPFFAHPHLTTHALFVDEPIDYISAPRAYEYSSG